MPAPLDLTGQRFGRLVVTGLHDPVRGRSTAKYSCVCDCGKVDHVSIGKNLLSGTSQSCGCARREASAVRRHDLSGRKFNRWLVISPVHDKARYFFCRCECGTEQNVFGGNLSGGHSKSCGCLKADLSRQPVDLTGRRFGRLTVLHILPKTRVARRWLCECSCGEQVEVLVRSLTTGATQSCGCLVADVARDRAALNHQLRAQEAGEWEFA